MEKNSPSAQEILATAKKRDVKFIKLQFTDILGTVKSVTIPLAKFGESIEDGTWFDGSSIEGFARIHESDMYLKPDLSTFQIFPWPTEKTVARVICDIYDPQKKPFPGDPRFILKKVLEKARKKDYLYNVGPELEFYLFKKENGKVCPVPHDVGAYFDFSPRDLASEVRRNISCALEDMGITPETSHHECGPGQHEIDIKYDEALKMADQAVTSKYTIKAIASAHDLYASFMPKPIFGQAGSGMHVHQSLFSPSGKNLFYNSDEYQLSTLAYSFMAGQLEHIKALTAILNPTVNSYKRLVSGYEAPVYICWASVNRSALIRIPRYTPGKEQSARLELRSPDPSCNPYLAFAVMLATGLDGIERNLTSPDPIEEDVYNFDDQKLKELNIDTLPKSLSNALFYLKKDKLIQETLGERIYKFFLKAKREEWVDYRTQVTSWELENYLEYL